jgi:hypothetical protein
MQKSIQELQELLEEEKLRKVPVLIFANKQVDPTSIGLNHSKLSNTFTGFIDSSKGQRNRGLDYEQYKILYV